MRRGASTRSKQSNKQCQSRRVRGRSRIDVTRGPAQDRHRSLSAWKFFAAAFAIAGGAPPDLIRFDRYAVSEWAARGAFAKLDEFVRRDATRDDADAIRPENFHRPCWDEVVYEHPLTHERGVYAVPADVDDRALFY